MGCQRTTRKGIRGVGAILPGLQIQQEITEETEDRVSVPSVASCSTRPASIGEAGRRRARRILSGLVIISTSNSFVPRGLPVGYSKHRDDATGQPAHNQPDERPASIIVRKRPQNESVAEEPRQATKGDAAEKTNHDGEKKVWLLALFHVVRFGN